MVVVHSDVCLRFNSPHFFCYLVARIAFAAPHPHVAQYHLHFCTDTDTHQFHNLK